MNNQVLEFISKVPHSYNSAVLEVGSMCVNGTPREVIKCPDYTGIDFRSGSGVDIVMNAENLLDRFSEESFDLVLCCETLEHCENWKTVLTESWKALKTGGFYVLTTPTNKKKRHNYPSDYWRWTLEQYADLFQWQHIHTLAETCKAGIGAIVQKQSNSLHLYIEPEAVR